MNILIFLNLPLLCPTHGLQDNVLLQYFGRSLQTVNNTVVNKLIRDGVIKQPFDITMVFLGVT